MLVGAYRLINDFQFVIIQRRHQQKQEQEQELEQRQKEAPRVEAHDRPQYQAASRAFHEPDSWQAQDVLSQAKL